MRPARQLFGTANETDAYAFCAQPVVWDGTAVPTFRSVNICESVECRGHDQPNGEHTAGQIVNGQLL
jgi:hypothetical protein